MPLTAWMPAGGVQAGASAPPAPAPRRRARLDRLAQRGEGGVGVGAGGGDAQLRAAARPEREQRGERLAVRRPSAAPHADLGLEPGGDLDEHGGRTGVKAGAAGNAAR